MEEDVSGRKRGEAMVRGQVLQQVEGRLGDRTECAAASFQQDLSPLTRSPLHCQAHAE